MTPPTGECVECETFDGETVVHHLEDLPHVQELHALLDAANEEIARLKADLEKCGLGACEATRRTDVETSRAISEVSK